MFISIISRCLVVRRCWSVVS